MTVLGFRTLRKNLETRYLKQLSYGSGREFVAPLLTALDQVMCCWMPVAVRKNCATKFHHMYAILGWIEFSRKFIGA